VFVLPNLYGDIITDEAAQLQGGVGSAGSANVGDRYAMFEAIHGSAPRLLAEGLGDYVNPTSILRATQMLLGHAGFYAEARRLDQALSSCRTCVTGEATGDTCRAFMQELMGKL
jgi:isocitrate dehydrogenase (NAD+)